MNLTEFLLNMTPRNNATNYVGFFTWQECKETCLAQTFAFSYKGVWFVFVSFVALFIYFVMIKEYFPISKYVDNDTMFTIMNVCLRLALYSQIAFFIWFVTL